MKRILALIFAILMTLNFTACDTEKEKSNKNSSKTTNTTEAPEKYYTVNFKTDGGSKIENISVKENKELSEIPQTQKNGYFFDGWYTDNELKNIATLPLTIKEDITLYAVSA